MEWENRFSAGEEIHQKGQEASGVVLTRFNSETKASSWKSLRVEIKECFVRVCVCVCVAKAWRYTLKHRHKAELFNNKTGAALSQLIADDHSECQRPEQVIKGNRKMED